jgi:hypothetical protein
MGTVALLVGLPFVLGTILRGGRLRGVSGEHLRAPYWRWILLGGLAASALLAFRAQAWLTFGLVIAVAWLATFNPSDTSRT